MGEGEKPFRIKHLERKLRAVSKQLGSLNRQVENPNENNYLHTIVAH